MIGIYDSMLRDQTSKIPDGSFCLKKGWSGISSADYFDNTSKKFAIVRWSGKSKSFSFIESTKNLYEFP